MKINKLKVKKIFKVTSIVIFSLLLFFDVLFFLLTLWEFHNDNLDPFMMKNEFSYEFFILVISVTGIILTCKKINTKTQQNIIS